jgi:hypothetical protein
MDPVSPLSAIAPLLVAFATSFFLVKQFGAPPDQGRYSSIDGLRGYLAFFVFLHHSSVWYFYLQTGQWSVPPSNTHLKKSPNLNYPEFERIESKGNESAS